MGDFFSFKNYCLYSILNILDTSCNFVYRLVPTEQEEIKDTKQKAGATLGDLVGVMGGLMVAFEHGAGIKFLRAKLCSTKPSFSSPGREEGGHEN